ncbi:MAG: MarC family protein [Gammaproteobacteria bacterium]|nr:MarC family protein [Gammaproteobacteria bacterium]
MSIISTTILLVLVMNPLGNLPVFLSTLKPVDPKRHTKIILRETFFAYLVIMTFMLFGEFFLSSFHISEQAVGIAGGIIMFIIAIRMIFPEDKNKLDNPQTSEPFFVPLALPMTAGPAALTTVMLLSSQHPDQKIIWAIVITIASTMVGIILLSGRYLSKWLGEKGLIAIERLSGMMITAMAVEMFLSGINAYFMLN